MIELFSTFTLLCLGASYCSESDMIGIQHSQPEAAIEFPDTVQSHSNFFNRPHYQV